MQMNRIQEPLKISKKNKTSSRKMATGYEKQVADVETKSDNEQMKRKPTLLVIRDIHVETASPLKVSVRM